MIGRFASLTHSTLAALVHLPIPRPLFHEYYSLCLPYECTHLTSQTRYPTTRPTTRYPNTSTKHPKQNHLPTSQVPKQNHSRPNDPKRRDRRCLLWYYHGVSRSACCPPLRPQQNPCHSSIACSHRRAPMESPSSQVRSMRSLPRVGNAVLPYKLL